MTDTPKTRLTDYASCAGCAAKIPPAGISQLLSFIPQRKDPNLLVGTETHDDAGVYKLRDDLALVQTVDFFPPVIDDPYVYGQIAAANALSDVYAMGGTPITALNLVAYPDNVLGPEWLGKILQGGAERCVAAGCTIVGGHSIRDAEIKFGMAVTGTIHPDKIFTNATAKPGDVLVLTKPLGTGFVTTAAKKLACPEGLLKAAFTSMTTLNAAGRDAFVAVGASAVTDVTGFGLCGHTYEMASGSNVTIVLHLNQLPLLSGLDSIDVIKYRTRASTSNKNYVDPFTKVDANLDPLRLEAFYDAQTSGGLLISIEAAKAESLVKQLQANGTLAASIIGEVVAKREASIMVTC
ncbi:selenide, water dikinase SelD [soil metagenome]